MIERRTEMKIFKVIAVAAAAAFLGLQSTDAAAAEKTEKVSKTSLRKENTQLKTELDSLKAEITLKSFSKIIWNLQPKSKKRLWLS